jgi:transcriptional regulator with XRE-family HTH domain
MIRPLRRRAKAAPNVAARVRDFRIAAGFTQETLARRANLSAKYISQIENGHSNPSIEFLARLVEHGLGVPLAGFFADPHPDELRDDLAKLAAMFSAQPAHVRRRALRVLRATCED